MKMHLVSQLTLVTVLLAMNHWASSQMVQPLPLTEAEVQEIVDAHNFFRGMVDPPASNMQRIEWNVELAEVAQDFAEMCMFRSNPARADDVSFPTVGENLAASNTMSPNYTAFVEGAWFNRSENYDFQTNMCSSPNSCLDYVQLVWAETTEVGCGAAMCQQIDGFPLFNSVLLVCYYAPEGRIEDGRPYITGDSCTVCPEGSECVDNLCTIIQPTTLPMTTQPPTTAETLPTTSPTTETPPTTDEQTTTPCPPSTATTNPTTEATTTTATPPTPIKPPRPTKKPPCYWPWRKWGRFLRGPNKRVVTVRRPAMSYQKALFALAVGFKTARPRHDPCRPGPVITAPVPGDRTRPRTRPTTPRTPGRSNRTKTPKTKKKTPHSRSRARTRMPHSHSRPRTRTPHSHSRPRTRSSSRKSKKKGKRRRPRHRPG